MDFLTQQKLDKLYEFFNKSEGIAIAFSGGVDSSFLLAAAAQTAPSKVIAITARSAAFPAREYNIAQEIAQQYGIKHITVDFDEMSLKEFRENPKDRCYHCKKAIFTMIKNTALEHGIHMVCDGSNVDDLSDYRPGLKALEELEILSPLREVGLKKNEIRQLARELGVKIWNMPAYACLASRIPYGEVITREKLSMIEKAEQYLISLGFEQIRVRCHENMARIEVRPTERKRFFDESFMDEVASKLKEFGFAYVALDLTGYRTGSLNEIIQKG